MLKNETEKSKEKKKLLANIIVIKNVSDRQPWSSLIIGQHLNEGEFKTFMFVWNNDEETWCRKQTTSLFHEMQR